MASAANANLNAVRETMDGKYEISACSVLCICVIVENSSIYIYILLVRFSMCVIAVSLFTSSPNSVAGDLQVAQHWLGYGVSVHMRETV